MELVDRTERIIYSRIKRGKSPNTVDRHRNFPETILYVRFFVVFLDVFPEIKRRDYLFTDPRDTGSLCQTDYHIQIVIPDPRRFFRGLR